MHFITLIKLFNIFRGHFFEERAEMLKKISMVFGVQVSLCQKLLFLHQLTHNMMTDCSLNVQYLKIPNSNLGRSCCVQRLFLKFGTICVQHVLPLFCKKESFWQRFTCTWRQEKKNLLRFTGLYIARKNASLFQKRLHQIVARTLRNALLSQFPTYSMCSSFVCKFPVLRRFQITANIGLSQEEKRSPWYFTFFSLLWKVQCNVLISIFLLSLEVQKSSR